VKFFKAIANSTDTLHKQGLSFILTPDAPTTESIILQRRKQRESQRLQRLLRAEEARNAAMIAQLKALTIPNIKAEPASPLKGDVESETYPAFAFLHEKADLPSSSKSAPLTTTTQFALSQLPALKALLAQLRPAMQSLGKDSVTMTRDPNLTDQGRSFRGERFDFIESQTKRQLELRGVELDAQGKVRDGEWQSEGRRLGKGEVEGLERVIGLVKGDDMEEGS
jgi:kinetochore protein Mis12/MTW1